MITSRKLKTKEKTNFLNSSKKKFQNKCSQVNFAPLIEKKSKRTKTHLLLWAVECYFADLKNNSVEDS